MKIFVTGATGFIGSNFINKALSEGNEVIALRRSEKSKPKVELNKSPYWLTKKVEEVEKKDLIGVEVVVHFAAHSMSPPYDTLENCIYWNVIAPLKLFRNAVAAGVEKFVIAGSCFEYGLSGNNYEYIPSNAPLIPTISYAVSKASASIAFFQFAIEKQLKLSIHRIFHVYGPGESENRFWPSLKKAAESGFDFPMTDGEQVRDFIHVDIVVQKFYDLCENNNLESGKPIIENLGTGNPTSVLEFAKFWWKKWNAKGQLLIGEIPHREGEIMRYVAKI